MGADLMWLAISRHRRKHAGPTIIMHTNHHHQTLFAEMLRLTIIMAIGYPIPLDNVALDKHVPPLQDWLSTMYHHGLPCWITIMYRHWLTKMGYSLTSIGDHKPLSFSNGGCARKVQQCAEKAVEVSDWWWMAVRPRLVDDGYVDPPGNGWLSSMRHGSSEQGPAWSLLALWVEASWQPE